MICDAFGDSTVIQRTGKFFSERRNCQRKFNNRSLTGGLSLILAEYKIDTVVEVILQTYHIICLRDNEQLWIASSIHDHGK